MRIGTSVSLMREAEDLNTMTESRAINTANNIEKVRLLNVAARFMRTYQEVHS